MTGLELTAYRKEHGLTKKELRTMLGLKSATAIWRWEAGDRKIPDWVPIFLALKDRERALTLALEMKRAGIRSKRNLQV